MKKLYSIGEVARLINISKDALRYYDEISLFKPFHVDDESKYRYYSYEQLASIIKINELKELGFSLHEIKDALKIVDDRETACLYQEQVEILLSQKSELMEKVAKLRDRIKEINSREVGKMTRTAMIIDDAQYMNNLLKELLSAEGFHVTAQAYNGVEGIELFEKHNPDLIILDLIMPEMGGMECLQAIRKMSESVRIIIVTAIDDDEVKNQCISFGANSIVIKPFKKEQFLHALNSVK